MAEEHSLLLSDENALNLLMGMVEWYRMSLRPLNVNLQCVNNLVGELYPIIAIV